MTSVVRAFNLTFVMILIPTCCFNPSVRDNTKTNTTKISNHVNSGTTNTTNGMYPPARYTCGCKSMCTGERGGGGGMRRGRKECQATED